MVAGCAAQQNTGPQFRLSSSTMATTEGASMLQRGRAHLDAGLDALAIESFRAEIRVNPESAYAYNGLAVAYGRIGRDDLAKRYFETALAKDPSNMKAQTNFARLTGEVAPDIELAQAVALPSAVVETVSVAAALDDKTIINIFDKLETPVVALAEMPLPPQDRTPRAEVLAPQGVLSSRFAVAPARLATKASPPVLPSNPFEPSRPHEPFLPPATLPSDYRANGTRLERVSLGEVRLITRSEPPAQFANQKPKFETFGERLAIWLPQSVAIEQANSQHGVIDSAIIMAAIKRSEEKQKLAAIDKNVTDELPEFAYLFFNSDDDAANV